MRIYLNDGPSHGRELNIAPNVYEYRVAIPQPINILYPFDDPRVDSMPDYDVAIYRFMGTGFVNLDGACTALIFQYQGTSHG